MPLIFKGQHGVQKHRLPWGVAAAAVAAGGAAYSANTAAGAAGAGADAQNLMSLYGGMVQQQNLTNVQNLLAPYVDAGLAANQGQRDLLGLNGAGAQQASYDSVSNSPGFNATVQQGENAMRQNASATGGLRGGNFQGALAQYRPSMLTQAINQQYDRLAGLSSVGQRTALGVGDLNTNTANNQTSLLSQMGANNAGAALAQGRAQTQGINGLTSAFGQAMPSLQNMFGNNQGAWTPTVNSNYGSGMQLTNGGGGSGAGLGYNTSFGSGGGSVNGYLGTPVAF